MSVVKQINNYITISNGIFELNKQTRLVHLGINNVYTFQEIANRMYSMCHHANNDPIMVYVYFCKIANANSARTF